MSAPAFDNKDRPAPAARATRAPLPAFHTVLLEQIRAMWLTLRRAALIVLSLVALVTVVVVLQTVSMGPVVNLYEWPTMMPGVLGALLPIAVWARDERFGPGFLWTLPVDRQRQVFAKVLAGWVWLMAGVALMAVWLLAMTLAASGSVLPPDTLHVLSTKVVEGQVIEPATMRVAHWSPGPLIWAVPFTAATASYLLGSAFALGTRHPLRWVVGVVLSFFFLSVAGQAASAKMQVSWLDDAPLRAVQSIVEGRYGLDALLTARTATLSTTAFTPTGERAVVWRGVPDLADWRMATLLWTSGGLLLLWGAALRHGEHRRG